MRAEKSLYGVIIQTSFQTPSSNYVAWCVYLALCILTVFVFYWRWWKIKVSPLKNISTSDNPNHVLIVCSILSSVCKNKIADTNVLFFQLLRGFIAIQQQRHYGVFYMWAGIRPVVVCFSAEYFEAILKSNTNIKKSFDYTFISLWLKQGLVTSDGNKWRKRRKLINVTFHLRILEDFIPVFDEQAKNFVNNLKEHKGKEWVDIVPFVTMCTLDIICETAMGIRINAQQDHDSMYVKRMHRVCEAFVARIMRPWLWPDFIYFSTQQGQAFRKNTADMDDFTRQVIRDRKQDLLEKMKDCPEDNYDEEKKKRAFLDLLLDHHISDKNSLTELDIQEEVDSFMFAGHDTTAVGLSWALYLLGLHPEIQKKVQEEVDSVFGDDVNRPVTADDLKELKYMECVIKEAQRVYPPAPYIGRELLEDVHVNGVTIPKGTTCMLVIYMLHRDPEIFPNPEVFDPDRFLPENCVGRHPFSYCPFSAGPRSCIGQKFALFEEKTVLANFFRHFNIQSLDQRDKLQLVAEMVLRSRYGLRVKITPR